MHNTIPERCAAASLLFTFAAAVISILGYAPTVRAQQGEPVASLPLNQMIIKFRDRALQERNPQQLDQEIANLSIRAGIALRVHRQMSGGAHVLRLPGALPRDRVDQIALRLREDPRVLYAHADSIGTTMATPNDSRYTDQWHYFESTGGANLPNAWDITTGRGDIVVAVLDTGIVSHADLSSRVLGGYDFVSNLLTANDGDGRDSNPADPGGATWHGTHTAGTIGAESNNGTGVAGINWISPVLNVRVLGLGGNGIQSDVIDGVRWAAGLAVPGISINSDPANVLNLSLGFSESCSAAFQDAIDDVVATGANVVVSAGNDSGNPLNKNPAGCDSVITVAATDRQGDRASYSNYGAAIEISAPGGETSPQAQNGVLSTLNTGTSSPGSDTYSFYQGTSMAAPHVSGVVSLMLSVNPNLTPPQTLQLLQQSARAFPSGSACSTSTCGAGIVDAAGAVQAARDKLTQDLLPALLTILNQ